MYSCSARTPNIYCIPNCFIPPKVKSNEEEILTEVVPKEVVTKEGVKHADFLPSDCQDEAVFKRDVHDGDLVVTMLP